MIEFKSKLVYDVLFEAGYKPNKKRGWIAGGFVKRVKNGQWHAIPRSPILLTKTVDIHFDCFDRNNYHRIKIFDDTRHLALLRRLARKIKKEINGC